MSVRIKMCGMTKVEDALHAAELGVNAIGLIFYEKSPRAISVQQAKTIVAALPPFITTVGVFVNAEQTQIKNILQQVQLDLLQFHGEETATACEIYQKPYIKAISMKADRDLLQYAAHYPTAKAFLLDTFSAEKWGGTGQTFNWKKIPKAFPKPIILAGGLSAENVAEAITQVHPYAVDVTSSIELAPGEKDFKKMEEFVTAVKSL